MLQQERLCFDPLSSFHLVFFSKVWFLYSNHVLWKSSSSSLYVIVFAGGFIHGLNNLTYGIDIEKIRLMGILQVYIGLFPSFLLSLPNTCNVLDVFLLCFQRIAIAYLVAALCEIWFKGNHNVTSELSMIKKYKFHW